MKRFICWILSKIFPYKGEYNILNIIVESQDHPQESNWEELKWKEEK